MKSRVYLETSVVSYLTALPSRDVVRAGHQQSTLEWWAARDAFELFVSEVVLTEARMGDAAAAGRRLAALDGLPALVAVAEAHALAAVLLSAAVMPRSAAIDALHVAIATVHGIDFLLTWNCSHIANAVMRPRIEAACREHGFEPPTICTPEELRAQEEQ